MGKTWAIGDIHGCFDPFKKALKIIDFEGGDILIIMGDFIDRGNNIYLTVKKIKNLQKKYPKQVIVLKGNHEDMLVDELIFRNSVAHTYSGIIESTPTIKDYNKHKADIMEDFQWFNKLPLYYETDEYLFVHAGIRPGIPMNKQKYDDLLSIREEFYNSTAKFDKTIIFGHSPFPKAGWTRSGNIGLDTGCLYSGVLTLLNVTDLEFHEIYDESLRCENYYQLVGSAHSTLRTNRRGVR